MAPFRAILASGLLLGAIGVLAIRVGSETTLAGLQDGHAENLTTYSELTDLGDLGFIWNLPAWMPTPPVPDDNPMSAAKVELGRHLFYDARLSIDQSISCASCHIQELAFSDGRAFAVGVGGALTRHNSPSLANVGYNPSLTWSNPHAGTLELQSLFPLFGTEPVEMGMAGREDSLFQTIGDDLYYQNAFIEAFPEQSGEITLFTLTRALATFQRSIVSLNSAYDRYKYGGDLDALSDPAKRGEQLFFDHRFECYHCHTGVMFTDNMQTSNSAFAETAFHNNGLYNIGEENAYPAGGQGLATFTGMPGDVGKFRTPSLRNVALTAPYMHDGSIDTLMGVLAHYRRGGRILTSGQEAGDGSQHPNKSVLLTGFEASDAEVRDLIAFLESLTDDTLLTNPAYADPWPLGHPAKGQ